MSATHTTHSYTHPQRVGLTWNEWLNSSIAEKGNDHKTCAYMEQLALYDYLSQMPLHLRPRCPFPCKCASHNTWVRRAWKALMTKPTLYRLDIRGHALHCVVGGKCHCTMMPLRDDTGCPNYAAMEKVCECLWLLCLFISYRSRLCGHGKCV